MIITSSLNEISTDQLENSVVVRGAGGVIPPARFRARIFKVLRSPRTNSASICSLAGRYDNPIPTRFLAPLDCLKIPALDRYLNTTSTAFLHLGYLLLGCDPLYVSKFRVRHPIRSGQ
jgi:hypothetical protein